MSMSQFCKSSADIRWTGYVICHLPEENFSFPAVCSYFERSSDGWEETHCLWILNAVAKTRSQYDYKAMILIAALLNLRSTPMNHFMACSWQVPSV